MMTKIQNKIESTTLSLNGSLAVGTKYLWVAAGVLFICYIYFVGAITFSVVDQRSRASATKLLTSTISTQEVAYLAAQKSLTREFALSNGFVETKTVAFAPVQRAFAWNVGR